MIYDIVPFPSFADMPDIIKAIAPKKKGVKLVIFIMVITSNSLKVSPPFIKPQMMLETEAHITTIRVPENTARNLPRYISVLFT